MNSPAQDIATVLQIAGIGTFGTPVNGPAIAVGAEPPVTNATAKLERCITLYDTGGLAPNPKWLQDQPTVQVRVRGQAGKYAEGYQLALSARDALLGKADFTVAGTRYVGIWLMSDISSIGRDDAERPLFTFNIRMIREPASGTYRS